MEKSKDLRHLRAMLKRCLSLRKSIARFGDSKEKFCDDEDYQDSVCMKLMQIGEVAKKLSKDFREETEQFADWNRLCGFRNILAHEYEDVKFDKVWDSTMTAIPKLIAFCEKHIAELDPFAALQLSIAEAIDEKVKNGMSLML